MSITRDIYVENWRPVEPLRVVDGSIGVPIALTVKDHLIPNSATAMVYALHSGSGVPKQLSASIDNNTVIFTPKAGFFFSGHNILQTAITVSGKPVISFHIPVICTGFIPDGADTSDPESVKSYAERAEAALQRIEDFTKGDTGDPARIVSQNVAYQASSSGTQVPTGTWSASVPTVAQGAYLWTRSTVTYNSGSPQISYSVARMGVDGAGSVKSVDGVSPDESGNVALGAVKQTDALSLEEITAATVLAGKIPSAQAAKELSDAIANRTKLDMIAGNVSTGETILNCIKSRAPMGLSFWLTGSADDSPVKGNISVTMIVKRHETGMWTGAIMFEWSGAIYNATIGNTIPAALTWTKKL